MSQFKHINVLPLSGSSDICPCTLCFTVSMKIVFTMLQVTENCRSLMWTFLSSSIHRWTSQCDFSNDITSFSINLPPHGAAHWIVIVLPGQWWSLWKKLKSQVEKDLLAKPLGQLPDFWSPQSSKRNQVFHHVEIRFVYVVSFGKIWQFVCCCSGMCSTVKWWV